MQVVGVLGGTFDPVHCGHIRLALEVAHRLRLGRIHLIPVSTPPHRPPPAADGALRLKMLRSACADIPRLYVDDRELARAGPSYTVDTLKSLREDLPGVALCLTMGMDAFCSLPTWQYWQELLELAHIAVTHRPGAIAPTEGEVADLLAMHQVNSPLALTQTAAGHVILCEIPALEVSATRIRRLLAAGETVRCLVPDGVLKIISEEGMYAHAE